ncbi:MAG: hypothetical protein Q9218_003662 [Villophora microphyllina]
MTLEISDSVSYYVLLGVIAVCTFIFSIVVVGAEAMERRLSNRGRPDWSYWLLQHQMQKRFALINVIELLLLTIGFPFVQRNRSRLCRTGLYSPGECSNFAFISTFLCLALATSSGVTMVSLVVKVYPQHGSRLRDEYFRCHEILNNQPRALFAAFILIQATGVAVLTTYYSSLFFDDANVRAALVTSIATGSVAIFLFSFRSAAFRRGHMQVARRFGWLRPVNPIMKEELLIVVDGMWEDYQRLRRESKGTRLNRLESESEEGARFEKGIDCTNAVRAWQLFRHWIQGILPRHARLEQRPEQRAASGPSQICMRRPSLIATSPSPNTSRSSSIAMDNGKAPLPQTGFKPNGAGGGPGAASNNLIKVQPPRREDLQPAYAQILQGDTDDAAAHGWYGSMSKPPRMNFDPGLVKINPLSEKLIQVDVKIQIVEVPKQVCMTKDNVTLHLTSVIYYHITSPHKAAFGISNIRQALVERTQTTLRHVVGARVLQDVIERREEVAQSIGEIIEDVASGWGVQVESMLIKDIIFSNELQDSLSMAAQSKRIGESKVIAARAEVESAKLMRQAADILSSAPAMQIRYLEAMQAMAKTANSKVIFLPAANQTVQQQLAQADTYGEGPSSHGQSSKSSNAFPHDTNDSFQQAMNARVIENI